MAILIFENLKMKLNRMGWDRLVHSTQALQEEVNNILHFSSSYHSNLFTTDPRMILLLWYHHQTFPLHTIFFFLKERDSFERLLRSQRSFAHHLNFSSYFCGFISIL